MLKEGIVHEQLSEVVVQQAGEVQWSGGCEQ